MSNVKVWLLVDDCPVLYRIAADLPVHKRTDRCFIESAMSLIESDLFVNDTDGVFLSSCQVTSNYCSRVSKLVLPRKNPNSLCGLLCWEKRSVQSERRRQGIAQSVRV